jgi:hypothetical protein
MLSVNRNLSVVTGASSEFNKSGLKNYKKMTMRNRINMDKIGVSASAKTPLGTFSTKPDFNTLQSQDLDPIQTKLVN